MSQNIRKASKTDWTASILVSLLVLVISGCNTRIEGCLQANAENFDLNAEKPCDGCCTFPSMGLLLSQKWNERNFANTDTLYDIHGVSYKISDLRYFLTAWSWVDGEDVTYTVDSVNAECGSEVLSYTPDILMIDTRQFTYTLGTIRQSPVMDSLFFTLGLVEDFSCLDPDAADTPESLTESSPLWNPETQQLETIRLVLQRDITAEQLDTIYISGRLTGRIKNYLDLAPGIDGQMKLTVDYGQWFSDADVQNLASFSQSILNHFQGSIFQTP